MLDVANGLYTIQPKCFTSIFQLVNMSLNKYVDKLKVQTEEWLPKYIKTSCVPIERCLSEIIASVEVDRIAIDKLSSCINSLKECLKLYQEEVRDLSVILKIIIQLLGALDLDSNALSEGKRGLLENISASLFSLLSSLIENPQIFVVSFEFSLLTGIKLIDSFFSSFKKKQRTPIPI